MTVGELLDRMSSQELTEWEALWEIRSDEAKVAQARTEAAQQARKMARR